MARRTWSRARRNRHTQNNIHSVPRDRRKQRVRDGPGNRRDGEQGGPVRASPGHPQQQSVGGAAQSPPGGVAAMSHVVRHGCPPAKGTARRRRRRKPPPRRARYSWARVLQAERDAGRAVAKQDAEAAVGAPTAAAAAVPFVIALQLQALHVEERHVGVTSL